MRSPLKLAADSREIQATLLRWEELLNDFYSKHVPGFTSTWRAVIWHLQNETRPDGPPASFLKTTEPIEMAHQFWMNIVDTLPSLQHPQSRGMHVDDSDRYARFVDVMKICNSILLQFEVFFLVKMIVTLVITVATSANLFA